MINSPIISQPMTLQTLIVQYLELKSHCSLGEHLGYDAISAKTRNVMIDNQA